MKIGYNWGFILLSCAGVNLFWKMGREKKINVTDHLNVEYVFYKDLAYTHMETHTHTHTPLFDIMSDIIY